ncbi:hypothetical protein NDU88_005065 [Pleurodeles waltl]|uniref:Uncharacterized protein n=1 Tax=Pleurodeles waltl TaxID=8319 RepID=A0AAV7L3A5_PLEWA|nr:hypothetical protein NDU88_005065 [Pleurodeles waltl]
MYGRYPARQRTIPKAWPVVARSLGSAGVYSFLMGPLGRRACPKRLLAFRAPKPKKGLLPAAAIALAEGASLMSAPPQYAQLCPSQTRTGKPAPQPYLY